MRKGLGGRAAGWVAGLLLLAGCATASDTTASPPPGEPRIDVATPQLVAAKRKAGVEPCRPNSADPVAGGLPELTLPCFGGGPAVDLAALRGPLVVNLWASWCGPCRTELPVLQAFHERFGEQVPLLGIDFQDPQTDAAMELVTTSGVTYPLVADPAGDLVGRSPFPARMGLPLFAFVREDGTVELEAGGVQSVGELVALVNQHLGTDL